MRRWLISLAVFYASLGQALDTTHTAPVPIYGYALEYRLQEKGQGQYNRLFEQLSQRGLNFTLVVQPFTRVIRDLGSHQGCIFPSSLNALQTGAPHYNLLAMISSDPVDFISLRVLTLQSQPVIEQLTELRGKSVGVWDGLDVDILLHGVDARVESTPNEEIRLRMLNKGRLDAILGFTPDISLASERLGLPPPHYAKSLAIFRQEGAAILCHDTPQNRAFLDQFNQQLKVLKTTGELRAILGPYAEIAP